MKTIAAALLVALSGKPVTEDAIKAVLKSVGAKENAAEIKNIADALKGKKPEEVIAEGMKKLSSAAPAGGAEHHEEEHHDDKKGIKSILWILKESKIKIALIFQKLFSILIQAPIKQHLILKI